MTALAFQFTDDTAVANIDVGNATTTSTTASFDSEGTAARLAEDVATIATTQKGNVVQLQLNEAISPSANLASTFQTTTERQRADMPTAHAAVRKWFGIVREIKLEDGYFVGEIEPTTSIGSYAEKADFSLLMVSDDDRPLLKIGASFSYAIYFESRRSGRRTVSALVFRRSPVAIESRVRAAEQRAEEWMNFFGNDAEAQP